MKKIIPLVLTLGIMVGIFSVSASAASVTSEFSGTQTIAQGKTVSIYFTASSQPSVVTGNSSVATVKLWYQSGNRYYYKLTMIGNAGTGTGVFASVKGSATVRAFIAQVSGATTTAPTTCSKNGTVNITAGDAMNFTVTSAAKPAVNTGNSNIASVDYLSNSGKIYNYMLSANSVGGVGVYVNGTRDFIANVTASSNDGSTSTQSLVTYRTTLINLINAERAKARMSALTEDSRLDQVADIRAQEASILYDHARPNGKSWDELNALAGLNYRPSENIAIAGNMNTATEALTDWMNSEIHRLNIVAGDTTKVGVSFYDVNGNRYCTVEFAY